MGQSPEVHVRHDLAPADAFTQNAGNRVFALIFGRGLVEPLDDHRFANPPLAPGVLRALVAEYHRSGGGLVPLLAFVLGSEFYAAECAAQDGPATRWLAARRSRPLSPSAYRRALGAVLGRVPEGVLPDSPLAQELALQNGPFVHDALGAGGTTVDATFTLCVGPEQRLVELWRTVLSRPPRKGERERFLPFAEDVAAFRDVAYALLTGREFGHVR
jgi:hypothetical protein